MLLPFHIAVLELRRYLVNRGELAFSIALPIALFALMYGAFGGESEFHATAHLVDQDGGPHARTLVTQLDALDEITVRERTLDDVDTALQRSAVLMAVVIPPGFGRALDSGEPTSLLFKQRGNGGDTGQVVAGMVRAVATDLGSAVQVRQIVAEALSTTPVQPQPLNAALDSALAEVEASPPVRVEVRGLDEDQPDMLHRLVPGLVVMFLMFAITLGAQTLVEERRIGTLERLMTTRLSVTKMFMGKFLSGVLRAELQAVVLLSLAFLVLRIGDAVAFVELLVLSLLVSAAVSAIGLVIGAVARTRDQAIWAAVVFTMFMTVFGGTFFDVAAASPLEMLSRVTINRYAIESMFAVLSAGEGLAHQGVGIAVLLVVTLVGLAVARVLFRVSEGGR